MGSLAYMPPTKESLEEPRRFRYLQLQFLDLTLADIYYDVSVPFNPGDMMDIYINIFCHFSPLIENS